MVGASVTVGREPHSQHTVFVKQGTGQRALAIVNPSNSDELRCEVSLPDSQRLSVVSPEEPTPQDFTGQLRIPRESAVVLLEL